MTPPKGNVRKIKFPKAFEIYDYDFKAVNSLLDQDKPYCSLSLPDRASMAALARMEASAAAGTGTIVAVAAGSVASEAVACEPCGGAGMMLDNCIWCQRSFKSTPHPNVRYLAKNLTAKLPRPNLG